MFAEVLEEKNIGDGIIAIKYFNGIISIEGTQYMCYSMDEAIEHFKLKNNMK